MHSLKKNAKIFIAGHHGIVGQALLRYLKKKGFTNLLVRTPEQLNLTDQQAVRSFFRREKPDYCFLAPVKEGGIGANVAYPAALIYENLIIQTNIIHAAYENKVKKLLFFASSCVYPKHSLQPMKEKYLLTGPLEPINEPYALAKIAGIKMCQAYNEQYGTRFICIIPATVFGPHDNFDLGTSHVIPALIRKFHEAKIKKEAKVIIWGTGKPRREFIYADDLAQAALFLMRHNNAIGLINVGTGTDIPIRRLAQLIKKVVGFNGEIKFDPAKPDGVARKLLDTNYLNSLGWKAKIDLERGLEDTHRYYISKGVSKNKFSDWRE